MTRLPRTFTGAVATLLLALGATAAGGQSLASRVAAAGQGEVRMTFATRASVCGDGRTAVAVGDVFTMYPSIESHGGWSRANCVRGPARVALRVGTAALETIRTRVGGAWEASTERVTDLGAVSAASAAAYFLDIAEKSEGRAVRNAFLAAVIADSTDITPRLSSIAQRVTAPAETRRQAINWLGVFGDESIVPALTALARSGNDEKRTVGEAALFALSRLADGAGIPALIELARTESSAGLRGTAVFWLGQSGDARGRREVRGIAGDDTVASEVRAKAVFALGQGDATTTDDFKFLRDLFAHVDNAAIRDQILMSISQGDAAEGARWLLSVARDEDAPVESRRKALFWLGQRDDTAATRAISDLVTRP